MNNRVAYQRSRTEKWKQTMEKRKIERDELKIEVIAETDERVVYEKTPR